MATIPNTFLIGAPKSGTTALSEYLRTHPNVFFATPKELLYWADDFPRANESSNTPLRTLDDYLAAFADAAPQHAVAAEGTVTYMYSQTAAKRILEFNPAARFVVMTREPVAMAESWHGELCYNGYEDLTDFEEAWHAQDERLAGRRIPSSCKVPEFLQYRSVCSLGEQLQRLTAIVPQSQLHVLPLESFKQSPRTAYLGVLDFLGLDDDGRVEFPPVNEAKRMRLRALNRLLFAPPPALRTPVNVVRRCFGAAPAGLRGAIDAVLRPKRTKAGLRDEFSQHLEAAFAGDVQLARDVIAELQSNSSPCELSH